MNRLLQGLSLILLPVLITACGGGTGLSSGPGSGALGEAGEAEKNPDRPLAGQDTLTITIVGESNEATAYPVSPAGYIQFPYLDLVRVEGLTPSEVKSLIESRLAQEGYFIQPQVLVIAAYQERYVHVLGAVARPGPIPLRGEKQFDILDVISFAGGTTRLAKDKVEYTREGVTQVLSLNELKRAEPEARIYVQPGDIVEVKESWL